MTRPCPARSFQYASSSSMSSGGRATEPSGLVSVIPHAWMIFRPWRSCQFFISASGTAEPPQMMRWMLEKSASFSST